MISLKRISGLSSGIKSQLPAITELFVIQKRNASSYDHQVQYGSGGRNSFNGNVITVFGGTGFLGRYVINRLARSGTQIVVPYRGSEDDIRYIRLMGDLGQIVFLNFSINDYDSIAKTMTHSNGVINLIGRNFSNRNFSMEKIMVGAAESIAKAAAEHGVDKLVHMSHLCAQSDSLSHYMQLKAQSEEVVKNNFPNACILKSAEAYGDEDKYLNKYAYMRNLPFVPLVSGGWNTVKRPVYVADVAQAIVHATFDQDSHGRTYELYGPGEYFLHDLVDFTMRIVRIKSWRSLPIPIKMYKLAGWLAEQWIFDPKLTQDLVEREFISETVSDDAYTFADLGITPANINDAALSILRRHRNYYHFDEVKTDSDVCKPVTAYQ